MRDLCSFSNNFINVSEFLLNFYNQTIDKGQKTRLWFKKLVITINTKAILKIGVKSRGDEKLFKFQILHILYLEANVYYLNSIKIRNRGLIILHFSKLQWKLLQQKQKQKLLAGWGIRERENLLFTLHISIQGIFKTICMHYLHSYTSWTSFQV